MYLEITHENIPCFTNYFIILYPKISEPGCPGSSEVPRNPLTCWDVSSIPANGIFLTKKLKNKNKNAQRVEKEKLRHAPQKEGG